MVIAVYTVLLGVDFDIPICYDRRMNKKRRMWVEICLFWGVVWGLMGLFIWPFLFMAAVSFTLIMIPVGVSTDEPAPSIDKDAWRTDQTRPWK